MIPATQASRHQQWGVPERIGCTALHAQGGPLAAMETGLFHLRLSATGGLAAEPLQAVDLPLPGMCFNDGRTDRPGRLWVTSPRAGACSST